MWHRKNGSEFTGLSVPRLGHHHQAFIGLADPCHAGHWRGHDGPRRFVFFRLKKLGRWKVWAGGLKHVTVVPWCSMMFHDVRWCSMMFHDVPWFCEKLCSHNYMFHPLTGMIKMDYTIFFKWPSKPSQSILSPFLDNLLYQQTASETVFVAFHIGMANKNPTKCMLRAAIWVLRTSISADDATHHSDCYSMRPTRKRRKMPTVMHTIYIYIYIFFLKTYDFHIGMIESGDIWRFITC